MSTIHISLTPKLEEFIQELLDTGLYSNVSEIIREALREKIESLQTHQTQNQKLAKLRQEVQIGIDQANNGQFSNAKLEDFLKKLDSK